MNNYPAPKTTGEFFKQLQIIHLGLCAGVILMGGVMVFSGPEAGRWDWNFESPGAENEPLYFALGAFVLFIGLTVGKALGNKRIRSVTRQDTFYTKLNSYRSGMILQFAMLEGPALINLVFYFLTGNYIFLVLAGMALVMLILRRPGPGQLASTLHEQLTSQEISDINRGNTPL